MLPAASYWNRGVKHVPEMTGASSVMDCADILDVCAHLDIARPLGATLDVGCGTGRLAQLVGGRYHGADIASDAVAYCRRRRLNVTLIEHGPCCLPDGPFDWLLCLSVFTHIPREERQHYLVGFAARAVATTQLLVDIIPGDGRGDVTLWTADVKDFESDLAVAGWVIVGTYERRSVDGPTHRYYRLGRRG